ncbi:flagellar basal body-associated protein flil [Desulfoluna butyratoxydans]|uniref:Flagellar protein FliL n=1 Tax=Desulfoluna butyratoxydans TaxID=231438 RepID=A0A4U8YI91_9BACT|nr:flagellar basal body-associated protein flil [Desulfoluna butyratoxydans]
MPGFLKNKKMVIILAGCLLLAVACAGAAWFLFGESDKEVAAETEPLPPRHKEPFQALWPLTDIQVPLSGRMGDRTLTLGFSFDLNSEGLAEEMTLRKEEIVEALGLALAGRSVEEMERSGSRVRLKYETLRLVNGLLESGRVKGVYITEFFIL